MTVELHDTGGAPGSKYLYETTLEESVIRFESLGELYDPRTLLLADRLGLGEGWSCWEAGSGGGTTARGLAERVGPTGRVLATDLDVTWTEKAIGRAAATGVHVGNIEARRLVLGFDDLPDETFDLIHTRLVLVHVSERRDVLRSMTEKLRPGGVILIEEGDHGLQPLSCPDQRGEAEHRGNRVGRAVMAFNAAHGVDIDFGRVVPGLLRDAGLDRVAGEIWAPLANASCDRLMAASFRQIREQLVATGEVEADELDAVIGDLEAGRLITTPPQVVSVWGRKPE